MAEKPKGLYVPLDVSIADHPKVMNAGMEAFTLYVLALAWSKRMSTDGVVPELALGRLAFNAMSSAFDDLAELARRLVQAGLWEKVDDGFFIAGWMKWNPDAADRERIRKRKQRQRERDGHGNVTQESRVEVEVEGEGEGEGEENFNSTRAKIAPSEKYADPSFAAFWKVYPRKKEKLGAEREFAAAVKSGTPAAEIIAGAERYAAARSDQDPKFTKLPTTWLNNGCWSDEVEAAPVQRETPLITFPGDAA